MIVINDFKKFQSLINDLKNSSAYVRLYIHSSLKKHDKVFSFDESTGIDAFFCIAAITSVGTIYIESNKPDEIGKLEQFCKGFNVTEADISCSKENGTLTIN